MAAVLIADRVRETSTTTGTGNFTLLGAVNTDHVSFNTAVTVGPSFYYEIILTGGGEWEIGIGHLSNSTTLVRDTVKRSTNSNNLVNFSAGTKDVFIPAPVAFLAPMTTTGDLIYLDSGGEPARLGVGTNGQFLTLSSGIPAWATIAPFDDGTNIIKGSADPTKLLRFEIDGFTTAITRVITPPNSDINLPGTNITNTWTLTQTFSVSPTAPFGSGARTERFGSGAGNDSATGADNICIGPNAGAALTSGIQNIAIGRDACGILTSTSNNIAIGYQALDATSGLADRNVAIGTDALGLNQSGDDNVAIGYHALDAATTGGNNVCIGTDAGGIFTTASNNICIGYNAGSALTTSSGDNVAIGSSTLNGGSGVANVAVGKEALQDSSGGNSNTAVGYRAGANTTTGDENVHIGDNAGSNNLTGSDNVCIGVDSQTTASNVNEAIALGHLALAPGNTFALAPGINRQILYGTSSTSTRERCSFTVSWVTSTDASRKARLVISAWDTVEREAFRCEGNGTVAIISWFGATAVVKQTSGADLTNNVTSGGTNDTIADFTDLTVYANDAATIRNDIYQLSRKLKQINDGLRAYGLFT